LRFTIWSRSTARFTAVDGVTLDVKPGRSRIPRAQRRREDDHDADDRGTAQADQAAHPREQPRLETSPKPRRVARLHPDRPFIYDKLTAGEFLTFHAGLYGIGERQRRRRVREMLDLFELGQWEHELIESFSHGMKQRLVMSSAFSIGPEAVASTSRWSVSTRAAAADQGRVQKMSERGVAILMSTHTLEVAQEMCHRVSIIQKGRIIAQRHGGRRASRWLVAVATSISRRCS
jgi:ABC-type glutathione transport system ATPase component